MIARTRRNAFTLIEVLLASALVAAITTTVCSSLWSCLRSCERRRNRFDRETSLWTALHFVEVDLGHVAAPVAGSQATLVGRPALAECGPLLRLRIHAPKLLDGSDLWVDYFVLPDLAGGALVRRTERLARPGISSSNEQDVLSLLRESPVVAGESYEIVATGVRKLHLRYYDGSRWLTDWPDAAALPRLVEVALDFDEEEGQTQGWAIPVAIEAGLLPTRVGG